MKIVVGNLGAVLLLLSVSAALAGGPAKPPPTARETLQQLLLDLREAKGLTAGITDKALRARMEQMIGRMEQRCDELQKQLAATPVPVARKAISDTTLANFMKALKAEAFDDRKGVALRDFVKTNFFTAKQAAVLVKQFSFGDGQRLAAVALHPRLIDPGNFFEVLQSITFDSDKDKVRKELGIK